MKSIEIENEKVERRLNTKKGQTDMPSSPGLKGTVEIEGEFTVLRFERQLSYPSELIWRAITDPKELVNWMNTKAVIDGRNGGTIDLSIPFQDFTQQDVF
jgi:Activator of Hsp90 ATPase homolog 1-like protein